MSLKERTINVDIMTKEYTKLKYKQGDSNQILKFKFYKNGSELDLTGYVAGIFYEKPNNEILEKTGTINTNTVTTTITSGVLNTAGVVKTEIFLTKDTEVTISFTILIEVEISIDKNAAVQEKEEWDVIKDLLITGNNISLIDDSLTSTSKTWSSSKIDSQIKDITSRIDSITIGGVNARDVEENETFILAINGSTSETVEMILSTYNVSVNENGSATFTIKLNKQPNGSKVVNLTLNNAYCTVSPSTLTFTDDNYNTNQTVTITGIYDNESYENKNSTLTVQSDNSTSKTIEINILNIDENSGGSTDTTNVRFKFDYTNYDGSTTYTSNGITATINKENLQNDENGVYFENAYLDIPYSEELVKTPYTLEIKFKKDNNIKNINYYIIDNRYATGSGNGYAIGQHYDNSTQSHKNDIAIVGPLGYSAKAFDGSLIDGNEHTVKFIYTGSQIKSYLDGTLKSTNNMSFAPSRGFLVMALNYDSYFNGYLKHFIIYDGEVE